MGKNLDGDKALGTAAYIANEMLDFVESMNSCIRGAEDPHVVSCALTSVLFVIKMHSGVTQLISLESENPMNKVELAVLTLAVPKIKEKLEDTAQETLNAAARLEVPDEMFECMRQKTQDYYNQEVKRYDHPPG